MPPWGTPHLKAKPSPTENQFPLQSKTPFQEMIPKKNSEKLETVINTCVSLIKQHWKKMENLLENIILLD